MEGVELIKDVDGNITGIRVDVQDNPDLAVDIYHLIRAVERAKNTQRAQTYRAVSSQVKPTSPLSPSAFQRLIKQAKDSGEVSADEFFQQHPAWRPNSALYSPS